MHLKQIAKEKAHLYLKPRVRNYILTFCIKWVVFSDPIKYSEISAIEQTNGSLTSLTFVILL